MTIERCLGCAESAVSLYSVDACLVSIIPRRFTQLPVASSKRHTASDRKLGKGLGTRLCMVIIHL